MVLKMSANCSTLQMTEAWHLHVSVSACVKRDSERNWFQAFFLMLLVIVVSSSRIELCI